jgi:DNA-binding MarR family transcriptional regulator
VAEVRWLDEREMRAWRTLVTKTAALRAVLDAELEARHGISLADYEVLVVLSEAPERRLRMAALACGLHLSPSGLTRRIDALVRRGWVERQRCPSDRRSFFAVLTPEGLAALTAAAPTHLEGVRAHFVDRLSRRQLDNLAAGLRGICTEVLLDDTARDGVAR